MSLYLLLKLVHVLAVVAFLGNIATGLFWHAQAARTKDPRLLAHAMNGIIRSDRLFTMPGVLVIVATGIPAAVVAGLPLLRTDWIAWTFALFTLSGIVFGVRVAPLQRRLRDLAETGQRSGRFDYSDYRKLAFAWELWGAIALAAPLVGLALMVLKPDR
jgi:uncharacterized membrane protein